MNTIRKGDGMKKEKILIVEDETIIAEDMRSMLREMGYEILLKADTGEKAIQIAEKERPDLVLMDIQLKGKLDGIQTAGEIQARFDIPVIYISAYPESVIEDAPDLSGSAGYIPKPFDAVQIGAMVSLTLNTRRLMKGMTEAAEWAARHNENPPE